MKETDMANQTKPETTPPVSPPDQAKSTHSDAPSGPIGWTGKLVRVEPQALKQEKT